MAPIYRAPMRARDRDAPPFAGARSCLARELVGIGGAIGPPPPESLAEAVEILTVTDSVKAGRMLERFGELPDASLVWTRTGEETYRLGRISGPWRYDDSAVARQVGIHHVRPAEWIERELGGERVPAAVRQTFARGGRNLQRTHDADAERRTAELWEELANAAR